MHCEAHPMGKPPTGWAPPRLGTPVQNDMGHTAAVAVPDAFTVAVTVTVVAAVTFAATVAVTDPIAVAVTVSECYYCYACDSYYHLYLNFDQML